MTTSRCLASTCRNCRFYTLEGRRGGHCQQLNVQVQGNWKACALAMPPFTKTWEELEDIMSLQKETIMERTV